MVIEADFSLGYSSDQILLCLLELLSFICVLAIQQDKNAATTTEEFHFANKEPVE